MTSASGRSHSGSSTLRCAGKQLATIAVAAAMVLGWPGEAHAGLERNAAQAADLNFGAASAGGYMGDDPYKDLLSGYANTLTFENDTKWGPVHPERGRYDFKAADRMARYAWKEGMNVRGHVLIWHAQTPDWLKDLEPTREEAIEILRDHIETVVGHFDRKFPGLIDHWDVVNEGIDNDGTRRENVWQRWIGDDYIDLAFRFARDAAGPGVTLYYNDYFDTAMMAGAEAIGGDYDDGDPFPMTTPGATGDVPCEAVIKCAATRELVEGLVERGAPIDGVGFQGHMASPEPSVYRALTSWVAPLGLEWALTEVDRPIPRDSDSGVRAGQAEDYRLALEACIADPACDTYITWGVTDRYTWWTGLTAGALDDALPYTADLEPKLAAEALTQAMSAAAVGACPRTRRAVRMPRWARDPTTRRVRLTVVGPRKTKRISKPHRRAFINVSGARPGRVEIRITGAVPGARDYRLRRAMRQVAAC